jgi:hypothetical protein
MHPGGEETPTPVSRREVQAQDACLCPWLERLSASILPFMSQATSAPLRYEVTPRDPTRELYDRACELLLAAQEMSAAAREPGSAPAIAATAGCLDASLAALSEAVAAMRLEATRQVARSAPDFSDSLPTGAIHALQREFSGLIDALAAAHRAADQTRERVGPMLAQLTLT